MNDNSARPIAWVYRLHPSFRPRQHIFSIRPVEEELIGMLSFIADIEDAGRDFVRSRGIRRKKDVLEIHSLLRAFLRQGRQFYESAKGLPFRTSPLFYYYSFLNFANAYIALSHPGLFKRKVYHGLKHKRPTGSFERQYVYSDDGVFPYLYKGLTQVVLKRRTPLRISNLLGFIPDISYDYQIAGYGPRKQSVGKTKICADTNKTCYWPVMALLAPSTIKPYKSYFSGLFKYMEEVTIPILQCKDVFQVTGPDVRRFGFYQSKATYRQSKPGEVPVDRIRDDFISALGPARSFPTLQKGVDVQISTPLTLQNQIPMNETLAAYATMFYLGNLIRYFPAYLDSLFDSKDAWILQRFTVNAGLVFLRNITNAILNIDYVIES